MAGITGKGGIVKDQPNLFPEYLAQLGLQMAAWLCMEIDEFCVLTSDFQLASVWMKIYIKLLLASPQF